MARASVLPQVVGHYVADSLGFKLPVFAVDFSRRRCRKRKALRSEGAQRIIELDRREQQFAREAASRVVAGRVMSLGVAPDCVVLCAGERDCDLR